MRRQAAWLFVSRGSGSALQALLLILFARAVDPELFGEVNVVLGTAVFLGVIADLGLSSYIVRSISFDANEDMARSALKLNRISTFVFMVVLGIALLSVAGGLGFSPWLVLLVVWVGLEKNVEAQLAVFIADQNVVVPAISILVRRVLPVLVFFPLYALQVDPQAALCISMSLGAAAGALHSARSLRSRMPQVDREMPRFRAVFTASVPFFVGTVAAQARNLDTVVIGILAGTSTAGKYSAASRLTVPIFLVTSAVATSVMPAVARGGVRLARKIVAVLFVGLLLSLALVAVANPLAEIVMVGIFGDAYAGTGLLFALILAATVCNSVVSPLTALIQSYDGARFTAVTGSVFSVVLLLALCIGAVAGGSVGAAVAGLLTQVANAAVAFVLATVMIRRNS